MKNYNKRSETQIAAVGNNSANPKSLNMEDVDLFIEQLEEVIAPASDIFRHNHNETLVHNTEEIELEVEDLEEVIAPSAGGAGAERR